MPPLIPECATFYSSYKEQYPNLVRAASLAERRVAKSLDDGNVAYHSVAARAKEPASVLDKLRRKAYKRPNRMLTDQVGVRVITHYQDEVDQAVAVLRSAFAIDERRSVDKREDLPAGQFGYRSVHLIVKVPTPALDGSEAELGRRWFEIQVRSLLEHAWAEIEHEVVYKGGSSIAIGMQRRFFAMAGALELLDREFLALREERARLVDGYAVRYGDGLDGDVEFDAPRLMAFLETAYPDGRSWRKAEKYGLPFPPGSAIVLSEALGATGVGTASLWRARFATKALQERVNDFAAASGLAPDELSHLARVLLCLADVAGEKIAVDYPDVAEFMAELLDL